MHLFDHQFDPPAGDPVGPIAELTTREIEDAGVREVLQTPGAALGSWSLLDALLAPGQDFIFKEPLGRAREVKTALSGLFGRFVARAYAERHLQLPHFAHLYSNQMWLDRRRRAEVRRISRAAGDLPDWVAWSPGGALAIIEAKGCYRNGSSTLVRAFKQAERVEVLVRGRVAPFKRYAIVTQWSVSSSKSKRSGLRVKDPENGAEPLDEHDRRSVGIGVARRHFGSLLRSLGHTELSNMLLRLASAEDENGDSELARANQILDESPGRQAQAGGRQSPSDQLIGGMVTKAGPLADAGRLSQVDIDVLRRLNLGATFVGVERRAIAATIRGDADSLWSLRVAETLTGPADRAIGPTTDGGGSWVVRLDQDDAELL